MNDIVIHEVGLRDGLQVEKQIVPTDTKIQWIETLIRSGIDILQLGSFVRAESVPQMADTDRLFSHFKEPGKKPDSVVLSGLVLNEKGLERGTACGVEMFCMGVSASDTYSRKNTGMSSDEALTRIVGMAKKAVSDGKRVQVSVQNAFGCGYEGPIPEEKVLGIVKHYLDAGLRNISLADTSGHAHPQQVEKLFGAAMELEPKAEFACHFHETYGLGLANCLAAIRAGVRYLESSFGGLGGSPSSAKPSGNVCTEDLVHLLNRMNLRADIRLDEIVDVTKEASGFLGRELPGLVHRIGSMGGSGS